MAKLNFSQQRYSLLSDYNRIQIPWIKVTIGNYTFGVYSRSKSTKNLDGFYENFDVVYPNYVQRLDITKINGQVNQYTLQIAYPVTVNDDPNFFEKVFSSVSNSRRIVFSYGNIAMPNSIYKDEEAIITNITTTFSLETSTINYTVSATSVSTLGFSGSITRINDGSLHKPSDLIKDLFKDSSTGLQKIFRGMTIDNLDKLIDGGDQAVEIESKINISVMDYISYLVSCMIPDGSVAGDRSNAIWILTIHDETIYDQAYETSGTANDLLASGPYFKVTKTTHLGNHSDAYNVDIGYNTSTLVSQFSLNNNQNYSIYYDYQGELTQEKYVRRLNGNGVWEDVLSPGLTSKNEMFKVRPEDRSWWTKITKYPIKATITIQGLLRPAVLMSYLRLNVIFPGGHKHISSGLYIITSQKDSISGAGYKTTLELTKIDGDPDINI